MKVLHVITTIERGGAETQLSLLAAAQVQAGLEVEVAYLKGRPELLDNFRRSGVKVHGKLSKRSWLRAIFTLRKLVNQDFQVIHAHLPFSEILMALVVRRSPLVITRHNTERTLRGPLSLLSKPIAKFIESKSSHCIAISDSVREYMLRMREWRDPLSISTIHYSYDQTLTRSKMRELVEEIKFITVSRLVPQKDIPTMLEGFANTLKSHNNDRLTIIGVGKDEKFLHAHARRLKLNSNLVWLGKSDRVADQISNHDVFVLSSRYEGFGLVLLEAMALGRPIIASSSHAVLEVLGTDYPGLFPVGDSGALSCLMNKCHSLEFRIKLESHLQSRLILFSIKESNEKTFAVYRSTFKSER